MFKSQIILIVSKIISYIMNNLDRTIMSGKNVQINKFKENLETQIVKVILVN